MKNVKMKLRNGVIVDLSIYANKSYDELKKMEIKLKSKIQKLEAEFKANPNKKTGKKLSDAKNNELAGLQSAIRYTPEFQKEDEKQTLQMLNRMVHYHNDAVICDNPKPGFSTKILLDAEEDRFKTTKKRIDNL